MYDKKNQCDGAIYTNNFKTGDKQPDWTGNGGVELRVALWNRTSKSGNEYKYARLDIPQKKEEPKEEPVNDSSDDIESFTDDDIPF